jgi:CBS domain containing-hemolysin-like protein
MQTKTTEDAMIPIDDVFMLDIDHILNKNTLKLVSYC